MQSLTLRAFRPTLPVASATAIFICTCMTTLLQRSLQVPVLVTLAWVSFVIIMTERDDGMWPMDEHEALAKRLEENRLHLRVVTYRIHLTR